jgi:stage II sporulation protein AA (anti-sigma F factor antagonist)
MLRNRKKIKGRPVSAEVSPIDHQIIGKDLVVRPEGELDLVAAAAFRHLVDDLVGTRRIRNLYVNLERVTFLDSSFLGALIGRHKRVRAEGGKTGLIAPRPSVRPLLQVSGILKLMPLFESERRAISAG